MRRYLIILVTLSAVFFTIPLTSCIFVPGGFPIIGPGATVAGSQEMATWEYDFSDFTNVDVSSAFTVDITQSDSYSVSITANENLLDYLDVRQIGKTLHIGLKTASYSNVRYEATITMPLLLNLELSGASKGDIIGFDSADPLRLELSGASRVFGSIETGDCDFDASGASVIELNGSGNDADIDASGASNVKLTDFPIHNAEVDLSGASSAALNLDGRLDADLSGASNLKYLGEPTLGSIKTSGGSTVSKE